MSDLDPQLAQVDVLARGDAVIRAKLEMLADLIVRIVPGCDSASVAIVLEGRSLTAAVTDHVALEIDLLQYQRAQGPCLDAVEGPGQVVRVDFIDNASAYQRIAPGALDVGVRSVLSVPLRHAGAAIGSLNLYSRSPGGFDDSSERAAVPFAECASIAIVEAPVLAAAIDLVGGVVAVMEDASVVEQAVGMVMHTSACTAEAARQSIARLAPAYGGLRQAADAVVRDPSRARVRD